MWVPQVGRVGAHGLPGLGDGHRATRECSAVVGEADRARRYRGAGQGGVSVAPVPTVRGPLVVVSANRCAPRAHAGLGLSPALGA